MPHATIYVTEKRFENLFLSIQRMETRLPVSGSEFFEQQVEDGVTRLEVEGTGCEGMVVLGYHEIA